MAIPFGHNIDLNKNQLLNAGLQVEPAHPSSPFAGQIYYNSVDGRFYGYSGITSKWRAMDDSDAIGSITAQEIVDMINNAGYIISGLKINLGQAIDGSAGKASVVDADTLVISDSADGAIAKKVTVSQFKTVLKTYFDTLYNKYTHPNHTGDVTSTGDGSTTISTKAVTLAKMANLAANSIIGNDGASAASPKALSASEVRLLLNVADGATKVEGNTNGSIKINGVTTTVYTHPGSGTNPHGTTAADIGLGNVTNNAQIKKRASSTVGYVPTWDVTTGDSLGAGYSIETTLTGGAGALPRADAVKNYIDALLGANDAMVFKGVIDASANPNYPTADAGHTYKISKAGRIGGASGAIVEIGDMIICTTDSTAAGTHAAVGDNWNILQANLDGTVTGPTSAVANNIVVFDGTTGKLIKDSGKKTTDFASSTHNHDTTYTKKYAANLSASATQTVTHGLNTEDITVTVRRTAGDKAIIFTDVKITGANTISVAFATAPAANEYRVIVTG